MTNLMLDLQQSHIDFKIFPTKINVYTEQAKLVNALRHKYEGTRPNSHVKCTQTYTIKFSKFYFLCIFGFLHTQKQKHKSMIN